MVRCVSASYRFTLRAAVQGAIIHDPRCQDAGIDRACRMHSSVLTIFRKDGDCTTVLLKNAGNGEVDMALENEIQTYQRELPNLLVNEGKFVVIRFIPHPHQARLTSRSNAM